MLHTNRAVSWDQKNYTICLLNYITNYEILSKKGSGEGSKKKNISIA